MARVCHAANRLWVAPNDCCSELRRTTQAICDAWPLEFERTKLPCACSPMCLPRQAQVLRRSAQSDPAAAVSVLTDDAAALIDLDQLPK